MTFQDILDSEIERRINQRYNFQNQQIEKPRKFYDKELLNTWNFKKDLLCWLVDTDHHEPYILRMKEMSTKFKEKGKQLWSVQNELKQKYSKDFSFRRPSKKISH